MLKLNVDMRTRFIVQRDGDHWRIAHERLTDSGEHWMSVGRITHGVADDIHIQADNVNEEG